MAGPPLDYGTAQKTAAAIRARGGNQVHASRDMGIAAATVASRVRVIRARWPKLLEGVGVGKGGTAAVRKDSTLAEDVALHRARESARAAEAKLKEATARIAALEARIADLEWAGNVSLKPAAWTHDARAPKNKSPHIPLLFFSDAQAGEVVRAEETDTRWPYDSEIFRQRYRRMISATIDLSLNHGGARWSYPGCVYLRGGDNISGGLHEDLRELGEDAPPILQCELVAEEEAAGLSKLAEAFGRVEVHTPGAAGNHDRSTAKPMSKLAWARTFDRLIHKLLTVEFRNDPRVSFHVSRSPDIRFPVFEKRLLCTHGDRIGSRGGLGFIGPGATILRGWQKVLAEQMKLGFFIDMIFTGHFHYPMALPWGVGNGSFTGTTEFGKLHRMTPEAPLQYLLFFHAVHGCVDTRPLYLADG